MSAGFDRRAVRIATVIKLGGRAQGDPRLASAVAARWHDWRDAWRRSSPGGTASGLWGGAFCLVHGGGHVVSALQRSGGIEPTFIGGRRVTAAGDIDLLRMGMSGLANKRLVAALAAAGVPAVGMSGEDGRLLVAEPLSDAGLGAVGSVRHVEVALLAALLGAGYLPVISPLAAGEAGASAVALNVNGDDAAAAIAAAVGADELLLLSDVSAVQIAGRPVHALIGKGAERAITAGEITGGMTVKVLAALAALDRGVGRVRIGGLGLLTGDEPGTAIDREADAHPTLDERVAVSAAGVAGPGATP